LGTMSTGRHGIVTVSTNRRKTTEDAVMEDEVLVFWELKPSPAFSAG